MDEGDLLIVTYSIRAESLWARLLSSEAWHVVKPTPTKEPGMIYLVFLEKSPTYNLYHIFPKAQVASNKNAHKL